jgi:beta-glucosidase
MARFHQDLGEFLWGVATSGYQHEGGYNGPGQPHNNWCHAEVTGNVMRSGATAEFWTRYDADFQRCRDLGLNAFRLSLEWSRIQPTLTCAASPVPDFDTAALDGYADRVAACRRYGLEPIITLFHFAHPAWLGFDPWLQDATVGLFTEFVRVTATHVNRRLTDHHGCEPIRWYVTINEPNILVLNSYLGRQFPAQHPPGSGVVLRAYNRLLAAHVRAYGVLHDLHESEGWPPPRVSLNTYCNDLYWSDKLLWDLLHSRKRGVSRARLRDYVYARARNLDQELLSARLPFQRTIAYALGRVLHGVADWIGYHSFDGKHFAFFLDELHAAARPETFDFIGLDYYDPFMAHAFRPPTFFDLEFKSKSFRTWLMDGVTSKWWNWRSLPEGLHFFCKYYSEDLDDSPVLIAENGMALRRKADNSAATPRYDRLRRSEHLAAHVRQVFRLRDEGVPVVGYLYWSLTDNYEWGSFTPRFGLYSIDYTRGPERLAEDHLGDRPAETYARLVRESRAVE